MIFKTKSSKTIYVVAFVISSIFILNIYLISFNLVDSDVVLRNIQDAGVRSAIILQQDKSRARRLKTGFLRTGKLSRREQFLWQTEDAQIMYKKIDNSWVEFHNGIGKFYFQEIQVSEPQKTVQLYNSTRRIHLRLNNGDCSFRREDDIEYNLLYQGTWKVFDGDTVNPVKVDSKSLYEPPPPRHDKKKNPNVKIILLLASYRDPLCGNTLMEAFAHAKYPSRIYASVVQQNGKDDLDCLEEYCRLDRLCRREQVVLIPKSLERSRGVMAARYHQLYGIKDEQFCLQTDSHSAFEDNWDMIALEDWLLTRNEMAVLTTYPNKVEDRHKQSLSPARCSTKFSHNGDIVHGGNSAHNVPPAKSPYLVPFFGAGVAFSKCHANLLVPYDPYLSYLFGGEEFNRAARLWTWGYDMYAPKRNFVYHYYDDEKKPEIARKPRKRDFFSSNRDLVEQTTLRWRRVLGLPLSGKVKSEVMTDIELFGLGNRRTLEQYQEFSGVNLLEKKTETRCNMLGKMKWVPYTYEMPFYPAGPSCPMEAHLCCNTLEKSKVNAKDFLQLSNSQLSARMSRSPSYKEYLPAYRPLINPLAVEMKPLPCDN